MKSIRTEDAAPYTASAAQDTEDQTIANALAILERRMAQPGEALTSPQTAINYLRLQLVQREHEVFACLFLDNRHRVLAYEELFRGTIDGASVYPREVLKAALQHNAAALILTHNHPSGATEPSRADKTITQRIKEACELIDVRVLDHVIVGTEGHCSLAERGMI